MDEEVGMFRAHVVPSLEKSVSIPLGVAQVKVTLFAFAATDLATAGTVTFDAIGLFEH
jgi:hypothetical protein